MCDIFTPTMSMLESEKQRHYDRIIELRKTCEMEMFTYIEKYVLDGRHLREVYPVAHVSVVSEVNIKKYVYGHYVFEHIIEYEDYYSDKEEIDQRYEDLANSDLVTPKANY